MAACVDDLQSMHFSMPSLTEEEEHSMHLPDTFKCDACKAVAFQFAEAFGRSESKNAAHKKLTESQIYETTENLCGNGFDMYGLKSVAGNKQLSGPGLEAHNIPGMTLMGGKWPVRLRSLCSKFIDEIGDELIYDTFLESPNALNSLLCLSQESKQYCTSKDDDENSHKSEL